VDLGEGAHVPERQLVDAEAATQQILGDGGNPDQPSNAPAKPVARRIPSLWHNVNSNSERPIASRPIAVLAFICTNPGTGPFW
jgi:hypothetical protein